MPRKRKSRKKTLATLDFETDPFEHGADISPFVGGIYGENFYEYFWGDNCVKLIAEFIRDLDLLVYAHNGGRFDFFFLLPDLEKELFLIDNRIAKCGIGESVLLDSYLILPLPLSSYKKDEFDYSKMKLNERDKPDNKKSILQYLKKDCEYLYEWVDKFRERFGNKLTVGQAAFDQLSKTGYECKRRSSEHYDNVFREFFIGGRTECFEIGYFPGTIKVFDVNSAYPRAMIEQHPFGTSYREIDNPTVLPESDFYFAKILAVSRGALPYRDIDKGITTYFNDTEVREYNTTCWEIRAGVETKTLDIVRIINIYIFDETKSMKPYIDKFYLEKKTAKENNDKDSLIFAKFMLVSAYGKFGADPRKYKKVVMTDWDALPFSDDDENERELMGMSVDEYMEVVGWVVKADTDFGKTFWERPDPGDSYFNVAVAASITGWIRAYLWRALCRTTGKFYCDTDSIICIDFDGVVGKELGEWEHEGEGNEGIYIGGKKLYTLRLNYCELRYHPGGEMVKDYNAGEVKKAHKGARLTHEQIVSIVNEGKEIEWKSEAPSFSLAQGMRYVKRTIKST